MKIKTRLVAFAVFFSVILAIVSAAGMYALKDTSSGITEANDSMAHIQLLGDTHLDFVMMRLCLLYIASPIPEDKVQEKIRQYEDRKTQVEANLSKLTNMDKDEAKTVEDFRLLFHDYVAKGDTLVRMVRDKQDQKVLFDYAVNQVAPAYTPAAKVLEPLAEKNVKEGAEMADGDIKRAKLVSKLMLSLALIALAVGAVVSRFMIRSITRPLTELSEAAEQMAKGDLTATVATDSKDELGDLARSFTAMSQGLREIITQVQESSTSLASAANQLSATSEQIATGIEEVAAQSATVATSSEEMSATSNDIAKSCIGISNESKEATDNAQTGHAVVLKTADLIVELEQTIVSTSNVVATLGESSQNIGEIVNTIEDIADQTNLLALNAAIEAARAGEQGRGFAVVADEVRALAGRTAVATKEISDKIQEIQKLTGDVVRAMQTGVSKAQAGASNAKDSGDSLHEILESINTVNQGVGQIATAAEEQTATTLEISHNIQQISEVIHASAQGAVESAEAARGISSQAGKLQKLVSKFKV